MRHTVKGLIALGAAAALALGSSAVAFAEPAAPSITTDQADYPPGAVVEITGSNWPADDAIHVTVDDDEGQTWHYTADPVTDGTGSFGVQLTLPDWFVATYVAKATDAAGTTATTIFTDSNVQVAAQADGPPVLALAGVVVLWTKYKKDATCTGTTLTSGTATTDPSNDGYIGTTGAGSTTAIGLRAPSPVIVGTRVYTFVSWSGPVATASNPACVPGNADTGKIKELGHYVDAGPASKLAQTITFPILADKVFGDADFTVSASASSGLPVAFSAAGPCTVTGITVHLTGAGDCTITASQAGDSTYYAASPVDRSFTITSGSVTVTVTCPSHVTYTGSAQTPCTAVATGSGLNVPLTPTYTNNTNAGTATASASYAGDANHAPANGSANFTIDPAASAVALSCPASAVYTGSALAPCSASVTGAGGLNQILTVGYTTNTNVGTAGASASYAGDVNHLGDSTSTTFAITPASSATTVNCPSSVTYTGSALEPCTATVTGAGGLNQTLLVTYTNNINVGTAGASATFAGDANHGGSNGSNTFDITTAASHVAVTCPSSVTYDGSPQEPCTASVTGAGGLNETLTVGYANNTNAGTATASASYLGDANHAGSSDSKNFTIDPAASVVAVNCPVSVVYTGSAQLPCTASVTGAGGLSQTLIVTYTNNTGAGTAGASASYPGDANHTGDSDSTTFTIDRAPSITAVTCPSNVTFTGSALEPCSALVTGAALSQSVPVTYGNNTNAGTATASAGYAGDANHTGSNDSTTFTIDRASSTTTVTCPVSVTFDGSAQTPCSASVTGVGGLSQALTPTYSDNTDAGTATASATFGGDLNHDGSTDTRHFVIDKASSTTTVTCPASVTFDGTAQTPCTAAATGVGGLNQSLTPTYGNNTNAGTATASATFAGDLNHDGSSGSATFAIDRASSTTTVTCPVSVTFDGTAQTPCTAAATGVGGLNQSLTPTYGNNTNAGTATASATFAGDLNHDGSSGSATFAIDRASSTTTVSCPPSVTYTGSAQTPCTAAATGVGGLNQSLTPTYGNNTDVGTASASATFGGDANHTGSSGSATFGITKAVLTVTGDDKGRQYSDPTPALTATITGFVGGENLASSGVTGTPSCSTTATPDSVAGGYPIHCTVGNLAAANYTFAFVDGTFMVSKEDATIEYTGSSFFVGSSTTATSLNAPVTAVIKEAQDGSLGSRLGSTALRFTATPTAGGSVVSCVGNVSLTGPGIGSAGCTLTGLNVGDAYQLNISLDPNGWYRADVDTEAVTTSAPGTGFASGGGWLLDPNLTARSNFGFTVKNVKKGVQGSSLYIYRQTLDTGQVINGVAVPAGSYNWIIKSNAMTQMVMSCTTSSPQVCPASFTGKSNIKAVNRVTGVEYSLGGNQAFQVDVTDKGEPGSSSSTTPDTYALKVTNGTGTYYQVGSSTNQLPLKGGNIQVRP